MIKNNESKADRRVRYTKKLLRDALLNLMIEKPFGKITPTELCRVADINRNTFYTHYSSPEDVLRELEDEVYQKIRLSLDVSLRVGNIRETLIEICQAIYVNADFCSVIMSEHGDRDFMLRLIETAHGKTIDEWRQGGIKASDEDMELFYTYSTNGTVAVLRDWIATGMKRSPQELGEVLDRVSWSGISQFTDNNDLNPKKSKS